RPDFFLPTSQTNYKNRIVLNLGNGEFTVSDVMLPDNKEASTSAAIADVDGDGDNDILLGQTSASINRLYLNNCMNLTPTSCQIRPPDSTAFNLNGETYALSNNNYTQPQAEGYCKSFGYDGLARIDTQAEQDALEQSAIGTSYWLALTDPEGDYTFNWTRGSDAGVMDWCSGQPQQSNGYNCGYQYWHSNLASRCLRTYPCDNASYRALCETTRPLCAAEWAFVNVTYGVNQPFPSSSGDTRDVLLTDIDLDGTPDAIVTFYNAPTRVYMNTGGTGIHGELFLESFARWPDDTSARDTDELIAVDIDGDTDTDIVARRSYAEVRLYINDRYTETFKQFNCAPPNDCSCNPCVEACDREIVNGPGAFTNETATRWPTGNGAAWRTDVSSSGNQRPFGIGDMDGDDLPDFYIAGSSRSDRMVMNCGYEEGLPWTDASRVSVGEFRFNTYRALPERSEPMQTALMGDLNNDGYPDIFRCGNNRQPEIWINDTSGKWSDETATRFPSFSITCPPHGAILADLDMDGDLDIVIEGTNTRVQLVNGDGRGGPAGYFTNRTTPNMPNNYFQYTNTVIAADFDDDGDPDWFRAEAYSSGNYSSVFINGGDAFNVGGGYAIDQTNSWLSTSRVSDWRYITSAVVIDINGDRFPDLYVGTSQVNKAWLNVDGQYFVDAQTSGVPPESFIHQSSTGTFWLLADDFDADGDDDIIDITNYSGNHYHVRDGSNGYFDRTDLMPAWDNSVNGTSYGGDTGDIDGDGVPDVYLANSSQDQMLIATQNGFSDFSSLLPWARSHSSYEARLLDVDGDCDLDVYVLNYNDQDRVYINSLYSLANPGPGCAPAVP
ncbi:MAG: VCBS repeat-containing protein, partial [Myxococcales bacterium]|nr:VCBS repeat-containing protein [Myxococcales bacterium]